MIFSKFYIKLIDWFITDAISVESIPNDRSNNIARYWFGWTACVLSDIGLIFTSCKWFHLKFVFTLWIICLLLIFQSGKVHFSYIYGIGVMGCLAFYGLLTIMATQAAVTLGAVVSVLGYCLLPMVVLSGINILVTLQWVEHHFSMSYCLLNQNYNQKFPFIFDNYRGVFGILLTGLCILWCSASASKLFVTAYSMDHQQILIAYPCALLYGVFALITIF